LSETVLVTGALGRATGDAVGTYAIDLGSLLTTSDNHTLVLSGTVNFTITAWDADGRGFYQPVGVLGSVFFAAGGASGTLAVPNNTTVWNVAKGGATIPLKFNVFAGDQEKKSTSDISGFSASRLALCSAGAGEDLVDFVTTGSTSLRYDGVEGQFIQNWKAPTASSDTCYRATVEFKDGSTLSAFFRLRK
jgi:hypothetical protein